MILKHNNYFYAAQQRCTNLCLPRPGLLRSPRPSAAQAVAPQILKERVLLSHRKQPVKSENYICITGVSAHD